MLGQAVVFVHLSHSPGEVRHGCDECTQADATGKSARGESVELGMDGIPVPHELRKTLEGEQRCTPE
jgi:hypothetical protein